MIAPGPLLCLLLVLATEAFAAAHPAPCPTRGTRSASEACLRAELGIPQEAKRVVIVSQSSHLDWDWRHTFDEYFQGPLTDPLLFIRPGTVDTILSDALGLMSASHASGAHYYYSVAEMGYSQRFVEAHPDRLDSLRAVGQDLRIVGGGITSPDSLLPPGEAFIRDYLVGKTWVDATLGLAIRQAWVPDDFGHDAQLPIVLEAMGFEGVGFGRVPGVARVTQSLGFTPPDPGSIAAGLLRHGRDFVWRAADGSAVVAHWMPGGYCQGDFNLGGTPGHESLDGLARLITTDGNASRTPYIFIPIGCDFSRPRPDLLELVAAWNAGAYARTFEATHDFLVPELRGRARMAVFHAGGGPAWAVRRDGLVVGALWRNAPQERCDFYGAQGSDAHEVAVSYALRVPTGIRGARTGRRQAWAEDGCQRMPNRKSRSRETVLRYPVSATAAGNPCPTRARKLPNLNVAGSTPVARSDFAESKDKEMVGGFVLPECRNRRTPSRSLGMPGDRVVDGRGARGRSLLRVTSGALRRAGGGSGPRSDRTG